MNIAAFELSSEAVLYMTENPGPVTPEAIRSALAAVANGRDTTDAEAHMMTAYLGAANPVPAVEKTLDLER